MSSPADFLNLAKICRQFWPPLSKKKMKLMGTKQDTRYRIDVKKARQETSHAVDRTRNLLGKQGAQLVNEKS